jgi:hypothetical protein
MVVNVRSRHEKLTIPVKKSTRCEPEAANVKHAVPRESAPDAVFSESPVVSPGPSKSSEAAPPPPELLSASAAAANALTAAALQARCGRPDRPPNSAARIAFRR